MSRCARTAKSTCCRAWSAADAHTGCGDQMTSTGLTGYLAPEGFPPELVEELGGVGRETYDRLVLAPALVAPVAWAANVWHDPVFIEIASIGDEANKLRAIQRNWALYSSAHHRRA